ncbi:hypothetical protein CYMTET_55860 [Cymbomonas tetramitiformis]|uniref:Uncharacterized protein n=1 Tax=Cymbomonas tetramitiformis TaxID=36881 RepID=A0AAE0BDH6_9CHLO|nr:hypothetical protein CYMTET_55860 [Cymbomonas tetramitiformis]
MFIYVILPALIPLVYVLWAAQRKISSLPVVPPSTSSNTDAAVALRKHLVDQHAAVDAVYTGRLHRAWAKGIREDILGSKKHHYRGTDDTDRLSELVVQLRTEFESAGLVLAPFDLDDPTSLVIEKVNGLLYDVLALVVERNSVADTWLRGTDSSADRDGRRALIDIIKGSVPAALRESHHQEHAALRYPAGVDPQPVLAREQRLALVVAIFQAWAQSDEGAAAREKQVLGTDGRPSALVTSSEYTVLLEEIAALKALVRGGRAGGGRQTQPQHPGKQHPRGFRVGAGNPPAVGFDRDSMKAKPLCHRCRKAGKGEVYHPYRSCPLGGRQHSPVTAAAFCIPIEQEDAEGLHALALVQVFQDAADIGPEAFSHAALAYGPPAVLSTDGVGGIDVAAYGFSAAQDKVHFTHASFIPGSGAEGHASALVCGPAAAVGITPEGQVPAGGAAASASAVPAPAMPVSQVEDVEPAPTQSARVTTTEATCGYDTDDYEDFADGTFAVKPRIPASTIGCGVQPFGFGTPAIGALAVLSLLCISFAGVAVSASTASAVSASASATEVPSPGGNLDWETPSFYFTNDFVESVMPVQGLLLTNDVPQLQPPEPPDRLSFLAFQDLAQADLGFGMAFYYGMALHESGPLDVEHYYVRCWLLYFLLWDGLP